LCPGILAGVPIIVADRLSKRYGSLVAVSEVSFTVESGEVFGMLGPNGAGKTTTIDMVLGLSAPDQGSVSIFGHTPRGAIARGQVAAVMQTGGLLRDISVRETVQLNAAMFDSSRPVDEVLARAGILEIADRKVEKCSGGQQQRLRFAMALVSDPGLLILDEPTTGMDVAGRRDFWTAIRADAQRGRTVIFATHYLEEADAYADRIVLVRQGSIVADGTAAQIKNLASGRTVRASFPAAERGLLAGMPPAESVEFDGGRLTVRTGDSDAVVRYLLNNTGAHDVEVAANNLEEAFVALTGDDAAPESESLSFEGDLV